MTTTSGATALSTVTKDGIALTMTTVGYEHASEAQVGAHIYYAQTFPGVLDGTVEYGGCSSLTNLLEKIKPEFSRKICADFLREKVSAIELINSCPGIKNQGKPKANGGKSSRGGYYRIAMGADKILTKNGFLYTEKEMTALAKAKAQKAKDEHAQKVEEFRKARDAKKAEAETIAKVEVKVEEPVKVPVKEAEEPKVLISRDIDLSSKSLEELEAISAELDRLLKIKAEKQAQVAEKLRLLLGGSQ